MRVSAGVGKGDIATLPSSTLLSRNLSELLVSFTETVFTVSEGEQLFSLVVNKSGVTTSDITITINLTDFTAKGPRRGLNLTSILP